MNNLPKTIKFLFTAFAGICTALFGGADIWLHSLILFIALDYISGFLAAFVTGVLSSSTGARGLAKKMLILLIIALANRFDVALALAGSLRSLVIGFYLANEGLSIFENVARAGIPVPGVLKNALVQLQTKAEDAPAQGKSDHPQNTPPAQGSLKDPQEEERAA